MSMEKKEYEAGAAAARALGLGKPEDVAARTGAQTMSDRKSEIMAHPLAQGRLKALAESLADKSKMSVDEAVDAMMAAATPEERGAATALSLGFGKANQHHHRQTLRNPCGGAFSVGHTHEGGSSSTSSAPTLTQKAESGATAAPEERGAAIARSLGLGKKTTP